MIYFIAVAIAVLVGCLFGLQPSVNGALGGVVIHPLQASLISFATGTTVILIGCVATGHFPPRFTTSTSSLPWWIWTGGLIGAVIVTSSLIMVPRIGSLMWFASLITGQILAATVLDHFGWLGNPQVTASPLRLLGAAFLVAGLLIIVGAKWKDQSPSPAGVESSAESAIPIDEPKIEENHG